MANWAQGMSLRAFNHVDAFKGDNDARLYGTLLTDALDSRFEVTFLFDRISDDGRIAFFRSPECNELDQHRIFDRIDEMSPDVLNIANQIVHIRGFAHDIYIPDLKVDKKSREISLDWLKLFSLFFAEEKTYGKIMQQWVSFPADASQRTTRWTGTRLK